MSSYADTADSATPAKPRGLQHDDVKHYITKLSDIPMSRKARARVSMQLEDMAADCNIDLAALTGGGEAQGSVPR